jgi:hypothetical protein
VERFLYFNVFIVNRIHRKFSLDLEKILQTCVTVAEGKELKVCDLFDKLEEVSPGVKRIEREKVLRTFGKIFHTKLQHKGQRPEYVII